MERLKPKILGIFLFVISLFVVGLAQVLFKPPEIVRSVPENVTVKTLLPNRFGQFSDILKREENLPAGRQEKTEVLGLASTITPTVSVDKLDKFDLSSTASGKLTISLLGDSMIDTLGRDLPQLKILLAQAYPNYEFKLINHGVGATNIEYGLERLTNGYTYLEKSYPSVISENPDIVVVESFAYNPWSNSQGDLDRQWLTISKIIETLRSHLPGVKVILASTIGPNSKYFGDGSVNLTPEEKQAKAATIRSYLQNMVNFALSQKYPLADAYHASLNEQGEGKREFISEDNIHPSLPGGYLFSQKIVEAIVKNKLIQ